MRKLAVLIFQAVCLALVQMAPSAVAQEDKFAGLRSQKDNIVYGGAFERNDYQTFLAHNKDSPIIEKGIYDIYFEKLPSYEPVGGLCPSRTIASIFVNQDPTTRYTREKLWTEIRPLAREVVEARCPGADAKIAGGQGMRVYVRLYFKDTFFTGMFVPHIGEPQPGAFITPFAIAEFSWLPPKHTKTGDYVDGPYVLEGFVPTIFGYQGASNKAKENLLRSNRSILDFQLSDPAKFPKANEIYQEAKRLLDADYRNFPKFNFFEAISANHEWMVRQDAYWKKQAEQDWAMDKFVRSWGDRLSRGDPEAWAMTLGGVSDAIDRQRCAIDEIEGRRRPWWCDK